MFVTVNKTQRVRVEAIEGIQRGADGTAHVQMLSGQTWPIDSDREAEVLAALNDRGFQSGGAAAPAPDAFSEDALTGGGSQGGAQGGDGGGGAS